MDRRHTVLLQLGIAIVAIILFIGVLNSVVYSYRTPLVTTESLWQYAKDVKVRFEFRSADGTTGASATYNLSAVGIYHDGYIYASVPYPQNFPVLRVVSVYGLRAVDGSQLTLSRLVESGANYVHVYVEPINSTPVSFLPNWAGVSALLCVDSTGDGVVGAGDRDLQHLAQSYVGSDPAKKLAALFPDGGRINRTVQLDVGAILLAGMGLGERQVGILLWTGDAQGIRGLKLKIEVYGVSEKPVLRALTEPIYSFFAALYATLLAVVRRVKQFAASAFGGFVSSFTLTGLIGDPVTALILTMVFVTVVFLVIKKK